MPLFTTKVSIYAPVCSLDAGREPMTEEWAPVAVEVPADIQPFSGQVDASPLGYYGTQVSQCFFGVDQRENLAVGYLIRDESGECHRVPRPPECWNNGFSADHILVHAEWTPIPASLACQGSE